LSNKVLLFTLAAGHSIAFVGIALLIRYDTVEFVLVWGEVLAISKIITIE